MAKKKKKKSKDKVFNDRPRKVFRKIISNGEVGFGVAFIGFVLLMGIWFATRHDEFDPGERDISMEIMIAQSVEDHLYEPPLKRWVDPALGFTAGPAALDIGIFPSAILSGGWQADARVQEFDPSNLYEKINGQETQYKAYGFEYLHFLSVSDGANDLELSIELYDMGSFENALGIFAAQRSEGSQVQTNGNVSYYMTQVGALGITDNFYFKLTGSDSHDSINNFATGFVNEIAKLGSEGGSTPEEFLLLSEGLGIQFQDIEYIKEDVFQYGFAKEFWFGKSGGDEPVRYFVHKTGSEQAAEELFGKILGEHLYEHTEQNRDGNNVLMKHDFLNVYATLNQAGAFVYGLEGAKTAERANGALADIQQILLWDSQEQ